jgi:serine palmitoyltransferase
MEDLERVLAKLVKENARKPLTRRFIISEGLFENVGDLVNLPKLVELKQKYKFRIILDETWSYGVLGRTGGGVTEQQNVDASQVDMIIGSLAGSLCGGGGFCAGSEEIVEHQRLSGNAYTFSAALPAMLATTASATTRMLQEQPELLVALRENIRAMRAQLDPRSDWVTCTSAADNPVLMLVLKEEVVESRQLSAPDQDAIMQDVVEEVSQVPDYFSRRIILLTVTKQCLANGVLITRLKSMPPPLGGTPRDEGWQPQSAVKVCVTTGLSKKETEKAGVVIRHAITKIMTRRK